MKNIFILVIAILVVNACETTYDSVISSCNVENVYINEAHGDGDPEDWIEIFNNGDECSLLDFTLDDEYPPIGDLTFGEITLPSEGYWFGYEDDDNSFESGLGKDGETIFLCPPEYLDATECQTFVLGETEDLTSWGYPLNDRNLEAVNLQENTPGELNTEAATGG